MSHSVFIFLPDPATPTSTFSLHAALQISQSSRAHFSSSCGRRCCTFYTPVSAYLRLRSMMSLWTVVLWGKKRKNVMTLEFSCELFLVLSCSATEPYSRSGHRSPLVGYQRLWHQGWGGPRAFPGARHASAFHTFFRRPRHRPVFQWKALLGSGRTGQRCLVFGRHHRVQQPQGFRQPFTHRRILEPMSPRPAVRQRRGLACARGRLLELAARRHLSGLRQRPRHIFRCGHHETHL